MTATLLSEQPHRRLRHNDRAKKVGLNLCAKRLDARVLDRSDVAVACIVNDDVQRAEAIIRRESVDQSRPRDRARLLPVGLPLPGPLSPGRSRVPVSSL